MAELFHHDGEAHGVHLGVLAGGQRLYDDMLGAVDDDLCRLKLADALVVEDAALRPQDMKLSGAEGLAGVNLSGFSSKVAIRISFGFLACNVSNTRLLSVSSS